jgi:site-specific recombinase XerD
MNVSPFLSKKKTIPVRKIPLQDIIDRFLSAKRTERRSPKTLKTYREEFLRFQRWLKARGLVEVDSDTIQEFITHLTYDSQMG